MCRVGAQTGMRRRRFLAALGGSASLGLGGLLSYRASQTRTLSVASVETYDAAFRLDDRRHHDPAIESTEALDRTLVDAIESAIDDEYETDDPTARLSEFRDHVEFVRHGGTPYRLSDTFPRLVVTAEPLDGDTGDRSVASADRFHEVIHRHSDVDDDAFLPQARADGVVDREPKRDLRTFFERYDAVELRGRQFALSASYVDGGPPYTMTAERLTQSELRDARSVSLADLDQQTRSRVREAITDEEGDVRGPSLYGLIDPAPDLLTELRTTNVLRADGTLYHVDAWSLDHLSLSLTATTTEAGIGFKDPGRVAFAIQNTGDQPLAIHGSSPEPFGSLGYRPEHGERERHLYPVDDQRSSMWPTHSTHHDGDEELASGERKRVEYELGGDARGVPPGRYVVHGAIGTDAGYRGGGFPFRVVLEIE